MANTSYRQKTAAAKKLRKRAGHYVRALRLSRGLTQSSLSKSLGLTYYTFVSAVENGNNRIPPESMSEWANALGVERSEFAKTLLQFYDPHTHHEIFGDHESSGDTAPP